MIPTTNWYCVSCSAWAVVGSWRNDACADCGHARPAKVLARPERDRARRSAWTVLDEERAGRL